MNRFAARFFLLIFPSLLGAGAWAQTAPHVEVAASRASAKAPAIAPIRQHLFGAIPLSTRSEEARKSVEQALDKYENAMMQDALVDARHATDKDPRFGLGYALRAFISRRGIPDTAALSKAKALLPRATPDEQLLARWMISIQDRDLLPAIANMNDLLKRYPRDKHVLYLTSEWLYFQQDYDRSRALMEEVRRLDPDFPPVLNMLGYAYIETGDPDPAKAVAMLERYAALLPTSPNPQDSLGEVSRFAGDDSGSLKHYAAALSIDPKFFTSQLGLGDTSTLMGNFDRARKEYDLAINMADNPRDELHAKYQKALVYFWEGQPKEGRAALATLAEESVAKKEPNARVEIALGRAMLAPDSQDELNQLATLVISLEYPLNGMSEADRGVARAAVLRERARVAALSGFADSASQAIALLESSAESSRDLVVASSYESARGYLDFSQGNLAVAADGLAADPHSPLAQQQLALVQDKLTNSDAAQTTRTRLKYQRGPTVEWFLVSQSSSAESR